MNYNNKENLYGMKPINEKIYNPCPPTNDLHENNDCCEKEIIEPIKNYCHTNQPPMKTQCIEPNVIESNCKPNHQDNPVYHNNPNNNLKKCNNIGNCDNEECTPVSQCCNPECCKLDHNKMRCICTFMDVLYDEGIAKGPTVFDTITLSAPSYSVTAEYISADPCCPPVPIGSSSTFTVESSSAIVKQFFLPTSTTVSPSNISVNGVNVLSVMQTSNGYTTNVDLDVLQESCTCKGKGTLASAVINNLTGFEFIAKYILCGKVTTNGIASNFKITAENNSISPYTVPGTFTFIDPEICLPPSSSDPVNLSFNFTGSGQLINPVVTAIGGPAPAPVTLTITSNLMLNTQANLQVSKNSKVCFKGTVD